MNKSILHIYFYQSGKHICKKFLEFIADEYILHIYYEKIRINICNFV